MSFHMQKKLLGLQRNQIFNQGIYLFIYFFERGGGGVQSDLESCAYLWENLATPLDYRIKLRVLCGARSYLSLAAWLGNESACIFIYPKKHSN